MSAIIIASSPHTYIHAYVTIAWNPDLQNIGSGNEDRSTIVPKEHCPVTHTKFIHILIKSGTIAQKLHVAMILS